MHFVEIHIRMIHNDKMLEGSTVWKCNWVNKEEVWGYK